VYQLVSRFEIFRTGFEILQGMDLPLQAISEVPKLVFQIAPAEKIEGVDRESFLHELLTQERAAGLDFQEGPFVRACLVRVSRNESLLAITLLSLCADTLTLRRLPFDLMSLYRLQGEEPQREETQYVDFSEWQAEVLDSPETEEGREFWQKQK